MITIGARVRVIGPWFGEGEVVRPEPGRPDVWWVRLDQVSLVRWCYADELEVLPT